MVWYWDAILALVVTTSFGLGALLYVWTREEVDFILKKFSNPFFKTLKHFALVPIGLLGLALALSTVLGGREIISATIFIIGIIFGSTVMAEQNNKIIAKYVAETAGVFLAFFFVLLFFLNL